MDSSLETCFSWKANRPKAGMSVLSQDPYLTVTFETGLPGDWMSTRACIGIHIRTSSQSLCVIVCANLSALGTPGS